METVLVVDDELGILEALADLLREEGYQVLTATHGAEALARMGELRPDLVLTDWMMPVLDGPALVECIRAEPGWSGVSLLGMSAVDVGSLRAQYPSIPFLQKPFDIPALMKQIRKALDGQRALSG
ncbi:response regulator [Myxococcus stipitatus]|uniref:response regulator n=1 Tax=Myxococcus stipitatus TaxID=83455 RepID=UPI003144F022